MNLWNLSHSGNYRDCILLAANLGGVTDTTCAVAGGLAGIIYGIGGTVLAERKGFRKNGFLKLQGKTGLWSFVKTLINQCIRNRGIVSGVLLRKLNAKNKCLELINIPYIST